MNGEIDMVGLEWGLYFAGIAIVLFAQFKIQGTYKKYKKVPAESTATGAEVARRILESNGITDVTVVQTEGGTLSDHFDPKKKIVALSPDIYNDNSIASIAVAAHEVGHAIQHHVGYKMIDVRNAILPFAITAGNISWVVIILGFAFGYFPLMFVGIGLFSVVALFQLVTLPVEFDASKRALKILQDGNYLYEDEVVGAKAMLRAAAFTYVAGLINTILQILRLVLISNRRR